MNLLTLPPNLLLLDTLVLSDLIHMVQIVLFLQLFPPLNLNLVFISLRRIWLVQPTKNRRFKVVGLFVLFKHWRLIHTLAIHEIIFPI